MKFQFKGFDLFVTLRNFDGDLQTFLIDQDQCLKSSDSISLGNNVNKSVIAYLNGADWNYTPDPKAMDNGKPAAVNAFIQRITRTLDINGNPML